MVRFTLRTKLILIGLLIILDIVLRFQVVSNEIGKDSLLMHIMANSLSEFGYAKWLLHPLSIFGLYPVSYTSSVQFFISGISQCLDMEMRWVIFLYCIVIGVFSIFTAYLMAGEIMDNDLFKFLTAFAFSTSLAVVGYTTWTMATRNLLVVLAPLLIYLLLKCRTSTKYIPLTIFLAIFLLATHHLFYFLIPVFIAFFILAICFRLKKYVTIRIPKNITPFVCLCGFLCMFSIPFFTGRFIEESRYAAIDANYVRYMGLMIILAIGGLAYLIFKQNKSFSEWFLLLSLIFLTTLIYEQTYMKWFLPIFLMALAGIGLINVIRISEKRKYVLAVVTIFLLLTISFSAYYQYLHTYNPSPYCERYVEESTYMTGRWMKDNIKGIAISNDEWFGNRIFVASETTHLLLPSTIINYIYSFVSVNISEYEKHPITSELFWMSGFEAQDIGKITWSQLHRQLIPLHEFKITSMVENRRTKGRVIWHHTGNPVELLGHAYEKDCIYDCGNIKIWGLE